MQINLPPLAIGHDEVERSCTVLDPTKAGRTKHLGETPDITLAEDEVKVIVWSTLDAEKRIDTSPTTDPHLDPTALQEPDDLDRIRPGHFGRGSSNWSESPNHER